MFLFGQWVACCCECEGLVEWLPTVGRSPCNSTLVGLIMKYCNYVLSLTIHSCIMSKRSCRDLSMRAAKSLN